VGSVVVHNIVDDDEAIKYKADLEAYVKANPNAYGFPEDNKQFFGIYWAAAQVKARSHPRVMEALVEMMKLWDAPAPDTPASLSNPVSWGDRFRIRHPGGPKWERHRPHIDGPSIGKWRDERARECYREIFEGKWKEHDPYRTDARVKSKLAGRKPDGKGISGANSGQQGLPMLWQGWLAMSETGPGEGTLKVFPRVQLANAYVMLRPFFRLKSPEADPFETTSWIFDNTTPDFPGVPAGLSIRINEETHPNLKTDSFMVSAPKVKPGDMVFWHCDVPHCVEEDHNGKNDSAVIYIGAIPLTAEYAKYLKVQREAFLTGDCPPDHQNIGLGDGENTFEGRGTEKDFRSDIGKRAMGFEKFPLTPTMRAVEKDVILAANQAIAV